ncbi:A/G-specific adenine glycosylase [Legionella massiliensis]|uniref:Adenine DNA glycosylase n=1 Tax=Legionella massiliensis TaxID=1034943 RepID=A0A078L278_9GAMM|nr:A/G-specific adenine glycosylase [Legionella massiliensis]CDZ78123.1 A/G-specific adenine glycosylase [Legionella massiliensis]CEE13861.1 A/G-specific adenine glycosylase [Legionella massiliensis]
MIGEEFSRPLLQWFDSNGRKDLPWQHPRSAYRVWISEIMLQQTQVKTVIPYFNQFLLSFPNIQQLAHAHEDKVLAHWSGLGYYSRARNLHQTAKIICEIYQGEFPSQLTALIDLPGIGPSTAAAIASQAFGQATPILDGNVKRVLCRYFLVDGWPEQSAVKNKLWRLAQQCMPGERCADYTQAIMDLGATCCTSRNPDCSHCPLQHNCLAKQQDKVRLYPHKKAKKTLPIKQQQFLLLHNMENKIYLEKRPPSGIWGGLWCMPAIEMDCCPKEYIAATYTWKSLEQQELLTMRHSFSHFHLDINAYALKINSNSNHLAESSGNWFTAAEIRELGLAKPVSDIINHYLTQPQAHPHFDDC